MASGHHSNWIDNRPSLIGSRPSLTRIDNVPSRRPTSIARRDDPAGPHPGSARAHFTIIHSQLSDRDSPPLTRASKQRPRSRNVWKYMVQISGISFTPTCLSPQGTDNEHIMIESNRLIRFSHRRPARPLAEPGGRDSADCADAEAPASAPSIGRLGGTSSVPSRRQW